MGIFDFFRKDPVDEADPTDTWLKLPKQKLVLNVERLSLNDVEIGEHRLRLKRFGKPANKQPFKNIDFEYTDNGMIISADETGITGFAIIIAKDGNYGSESEFIPTELTILGSKGKSILVSDKTLRQELIQALDLNVLNTDVDEDEKVDDIKCGKYTLELESTLSDRLTRINLYET